MSSGGFGFTQRAWNRFGIATNAYENGVRLITREEIEQKMDELAREFAETHDPEIREEIYSPAHQLIKLDH